MIKDPGEEATAVSTLISSLWDKERESFIPGFSAGFIIDLEYDLAELISHRHILQRESLIQAIIAGVRREVENNHALMDSEYINNS